MRRLLLIAAVSALAVAKPETYREKEDFQFSRSSSDEGTKSGFYGAQRGNMGGNYERAHNMDGLAQHQMSTAIKNVEGELGDTSDVNHGRVFTAGNTRGVYGQANYNLENLRGRNFEDNVAGAESLSHSSFTNAHSGYDSRSSAQKTAGYGAGYQAYKSRNAGYNSATSALEQQNREALDNLQYGRNTAGGSSFSQSEYDERNSYNQAHSSRMSSGNSYAGTKSRVVPVRVVLRPGSTVNVPVTAEAYDNTHRSTAFDQNSINSDAEVLSNTRNIHRVPEHMKGAKHYESEYKYHKEWEKHDALPTATPLVIPGARIPHNSELYEDTAGVEKADHHEYRLSDTESQNKLDYVNSASKQHSEHHSGYNGIRSKTVAANSNYGAYDNVGASADLINSRNVDYSVTPKSYQSSYSYKKSWERQGDPYMITPVGENTDSQRLTAANSKAGYQSHQYGTHGAQSRYSHTQGEDCECDDEGNVRVTRSVDDQEDMGQQTQQVQSSDFEEIGQRPLSQNLEDFGQQTQNSWHQVGYFQNPNRKLDKVEDLRQHTQNRNRNGFQELTQQSQSQNIEDLGQQVQSNGWDETADLGQQTQHGWYAEDLFREHNDKVANSMRQAPKRLHAADSSKPEEQRTNDNFNNFGNLNSQIQHGHTGDIGDSSNNAQHTQNVWNAEDTFRNSANVQPNSRNLLKETGDSGLQTQHWDVVDSGQQIQNAWHGEEVGQHTENHWKPVENGKTTEKSLGISGTNIRNQHANSSPTTTNQRKPAFNTEDLFKPVWEQTEQNAGSFSDWNKFDDIYNGMGKMDTTNFKNDGKLHSTGTDEDSFQHSSQNWGNSYGESSHRVQSHHEVQYQFINHQSTEYNTVGYTTESNKNLYPWELTTKKQPIGSSVFDHTTETNRNMYPWDNGKLNSTTPTLTHGRGDIDAGDAYQAFLGARPKPTPLTPQTSIVQNRPYKTPAEIEALSLTKNKEESAAENTQTHTNSQDEDRLSVVSLNEQWLEDQKRHGLSLQSTTQKVNSVSGNSQHQSQGQVEDLGQQVQTGWSTNDNMQQSEGQSEDFGQQVVQTNWNANNNFHQSQHQTGAMQTNWNSNDKLHQSRAQTDNKFHQTEELGQQTQTDWNSENLQQSVDLGQQIQSGWNPNEKLTQSDLQRPNDFYSENHQLPKAQVENVKVESQTISAPPEITTKPPGFWKKVGGKVSSWFGG